MAKYDPYDPYNDDPSIEGNEHLLGDYTRGFEDGYEKACHDMAAREAELAAKHREEIRRILND